MKASLIMHSYHATAGPLQEVASMSQERNVTLLGRRRHVTGAVLAVILGVFGVACGSSQNVTTTKPAIGASTAAVLVFSPITADIKGVEAADMAFDGLPATCPPVAQSEGMRFATIRATGVSWATTRFEPSTGCKIYTSPGADQSGPQPVRLDEVSSFAVQKDGLTPLAVFERQAEGQWTMNTFGTQPFPCPGLGGVAPGQGNSAIPPAVLTAWDLSYAQNCSSVQYAPPANGGH